MFNHQLPPTDRNLDHNTNVPLETYPEWLPPIPRIKVNEELEFDFAMDFKNQIIDGRSTAQIAKFIDDNATDELHDHEANLIEEILSAEQDFASYPQQLRSQLTKLTLPKFTLLATLYQKKC